ncbi:hypothetical protein VTO42DRAFT_5720 [Malbranchea cinnamomea]
MSCLLEHHDASLPITAISAIELCGRKLVLSGIGPEALLVDEECGSLVGRLRVFDRNAIHGFHTLFSLSQGGGEFEAKLLVWGGQSLRLVRLSFNETLVRRNISLSLASAESRCPDWILDVDSCECLSKDATSDVPKRRVSLITAHNTLLYAEVQHDSTEVASIQIHEIGSKLKPVLYSADVIWISSSQILVAAGTVFGEIIIWSCRFPAEADALIVSNPSICVHHFFTGHEGSIFGVNISSEVVITGEANPRRFLASCSDDRTIRIWDISSVSFPGCEDKSLSMDQNVRGTGFGTYIGELDLNEDSCLAQTWAHEARIWGVQFLDTSCSEDRVSLNLISRGEDVTCQLWNFSQPSSLIYGNSKEEAKLSHLRTYSYHTGKHIWSLAIRKNVDSFTVYSGGADGSLKAFFVGHNGQQDYGERRQVFTGGEVIRSSTNASSISQFETGSMIKNKKSIIKIFNYAFVSDDCFLATTSGGKVFLGRVSGSENETFISWTYITILPELTAYCEVASEPRNGLAIIGDKTGNAGDVWLYDHSKGSIQKVAQLGKKISKMFALTLMPGHPHSSSLSCSIIVAYIGSSSVDLLRVQVSDLPSLTRQRGFALPPSFTPTSALLLKDTSQMILGSREGTVALYDTAETTSQQTQAEPLWCVYKVHGEDAVTSIINFPRSSTSNSAETTILTTGRDGYYCVHVINRLRGDSQARPLRTLHRSSPPLGPNLEAAVFDVTTNDLIITGFRGPAFVVWNESTQTELMAVDCSGVHRTWDYHSSIIGRAFLWTKAATFNVFLRTLPSLRSLLAGGHGREIKTMAISSPMVSVADRKLPLLATGSEDTAIRLFLLDGDEKTHQTGQNGHFRCIRTLKYHTAGLQHLQWSTCGKFLFSSSGFEQFYAWRIRDIPDFGIGAVVEGRYPKSQPSSDLRITHFDAVSVQVEHEDTHAFLILMSYSNSAVKLFYYLSSPHESTYTLLAHGRYTANCLTYIKFVPGKHGACFLTSATDGHIALWDLTDVLRQSFSISDGLVKRKPTTGLPTSPALLSWQQRHSIHQSSIKAMTLQHLSNGQLMLITGGDDNALAISLLTVASSLTQSGPSLSRALLAEAHVASINDVTILRGTVQGSKMQFIVASSGNDQRLKIWSVQVDTLRRDIQETSVGVSLLQDIYTAVADLSSMGVYSLGDGTPNQRMVLCGVGMDFWDLSIDW